MSTNKFDAERIQATLERERTDAFGPPEARAEKLRRYISDLLASHPEQLVREILVALSEVDDFIPAQSLKKFDLQSVPLDEAIRRFDIPWFYFEYMEEHENGSVRVDVSHGINLAAMGETFLFTRRERGLELADHWERWIS